MPANRATRRPASAKPMQLAGRALPRLRLPACLLLLLGFSILPAATAQTGGASPAAAITATSPSTLTEKTLHGAKVTVSLTGVIFVAGFPDGDDFELVTGIPGLTIDVVDRFYDRETDRYARDRVEVRLRYDGTDFDADGTLAVTVKAAAHGGGADLATGTVPVTATQEATDAALGGLTLSSGTLAPAFAGGATTYTANVAATVNALTVTATASDANASITVDGRAVASGRASHAVALSAPGGSTAVAVVVTAEDGATSRTYTVTVSRAAGSAPSAAITATSPSALTEKNLHGAKVTVSLTGVLFVAGLPDPDHFELVAVSASGLAVDGVERIPDDSAGGHRRDRVEVRLRYDGTDFDADGTLAVTVKAAAHGGGADLTTGTVAVTATQEATDAALGGLTLSPGTLAPTFAGGTTAYTASVAATVNALTVTATASDANASITVNGRAAASGRASHAVALSAPGGSTAVTVVVVAEDGTTSRTYTITVSRAAGSAPSAAITATSPPALTEKNLHGAKVTVSLTGVLFVAGLPDPDHFELVTVSASGLAVDGVDRVLEEGADRFRRDRVEVRLRYDGTDFDTDGTLAVTVKAAAHGGGADLATGTVAVTATQEATDAALGGLTLSSGTLAPAFAGGATTYTANVAATVNALTVTATASDANASITVNGRAVASGRASHAVALSAPGGSTAVAVVVTAEDGTTSRTYTVTVSRAAAATADLNTDGSVNFQDALVLYYADTAPTLADETFGAGLRRILLRPLRGGRSDDDAGYRALLAAAGDWKGAAAGDLNTDGSVNFQDALVMYYAGTAPTLADETFGAGLRRILLRPLRGGRSDDDAGYRALLAAANTLAGAGGPSP